MEHQISWTRFLKDVLIASLGAYGGPEAHYGVFTEQLVRKRNYLTEDELIESVALCSVLPGPTSTQTIISIGYKVGGPKLALLTMLVWALPVLLMMTGLSFLYQVLESLHVSSDILRFIGPMAVAFIILAAYRIGKKVVVDRLTIILFAMSLMITYFIREPWVFPIILVVGGIISILFSNENNLWNKVKLNPPWLPFTLFVVFALLAILFRTLFDHRLFQLFESFYRYGYLVFGGGQVVVPIMYTELVTVKEYLTNLEFLTGYGLVQGLPGPMFSFSAYAGGMAARELGTFGQVMGALISGISIFLPGVLLIFFVYPIWENLKQNKAVKESLKGIKAVAGGMITVAAILLMRKSGFTIENLGVLIMTWLLLVSKKVTPPLIVLGVIILGILL